MIKTLFEKGMPTRRDLRRSMRLPDLRRVILLAFLCVLAFLAASASAWAASFFSNPTPIAIPVFGDASPYPSSRSSRRARPPR